MKSTIEILDNIVRMLCDELNDVSWRPTVPSD